LEGSEGRRQTEAVLWSDLRRLLVIVVLTIVVVPVAGRVGADTVIGWVNPMPLPGAYTASVCEPAARPLGRLPVMVTTPCAFA
jgi:hypothetical protein